MQFLRQSTASQSVLLGPFIDDTDGATPETGLTIANTDIRLSKNGANIVSKNSGGATHDEAGWYQTTFNATDTNTVGKLQVHVKVAGALMVHHEFFVLEEAIYDALFASSASGFDGSQRVSVGTIAADVITAASIATDAITASKIAANAITATKIAANAITAAQIAAAALDGKGDWNIGKTGYTASPAAGSIVAASFAASAVDAVALAADAVDKIRDGVLPTQNAAFANLQYLWVSSVDHVTPVTGATGTSVTRSIDGGAFAAGTGTLAEISNGIYQYDASAADMNGGVITFRFSATGGTPAAPDDTFVTVVTGGGV